MQRVSNLEKDVKELKQVDHTPAIIESIKSELSEAINKYLGSTLGDTLQKQELAAKEKMPKYSTTPYDQAAEDEHKQKEILFQMMMASKSHERYLAHKELYDALIQSLLVGENDMDRLAVDPASQRKRRHDDKDQDPSAGSDQGKKRTGKDMSYKLLIEILENSWNILKVPRKNRYVKERFIYGCCEVKLSKKAGNLYIHRATLIRTCSHFCVKEHTLSTVDSTKGCYVYEDKSKMKRLMRVDEIHKFCDGTLQSVRNILRERLPNFRFDYNKGMSSREWTSKDKRCTSIMLNKIN
ncbi:hypothetical protein Tco_1133108 [Tanacetum coccineum]|uniref:Uncharacterized protein n=1 Tax=Tanacetum coccineum TaxID=301880 RepID=A0ABQ5JGI9_9ASTR